MTTFIIEPTGEVYEVGTRRSRYTRRGKVECTCKVCGRPFTARLGSSYCGDECRRRVGRR